MFIVILIALFFGFFGYWLNGIEGSFIFIIIGIFIGVYITSKSFLEEQRRKKDERNEARGIRRRAYHSEMGRQKARGDYHDDEESRKQTRKTLQGAVNRFGYYGKR